MGKSSIAVLIAILLFPVTGMAQFTENVWCFGDSAGIDFNFTPPQSIKSNVKTRGACTTVCDANGNLLLYASNFNYNFYTTPGSSSARGMVFNSNHQLLKSGDSIIASSWYNEMMLLNDPGNSDHFYLFHMGVTGGLFPGFYYSKIDVTSDGGWGRVIQKNIKIDSLQNCDGMHAVKHANGRDWWLVTKDWATANNEYDVYLISPAGVQLYNRQNIGTSLQSGFFKVKFNKSGDQMIGLSVSGLIELYEFDRCTGVISNPVTIDTETPVPVPSYWGVEFSPNGDRLYVSTLGFSSGTSIDTFSVIFQLDLTSANILQSKVVLDSIYVPNFGGQLELGPDGRIYFAIAYTAGVNQFFYLDTNTTNDIYYLSTIENPDNLGQACNYQRNSFYLGGERTYYGLPNNPNYSLGVMPGTICDSLGLGIGGIKQGKFFANVYPNPVLNTASIVINAPPNLRLDDLQLEIYDTMGRQVRTSYLGSERAYTFNRRNLSSGSYYYRLYSAEGGVVTGKMMLQ